jgi:Mn-dependent DtxR family transcriptional regulator
MRKEKVDKVVRDMEAMKFFKMDRLPKEFYTLTDKEKAEAINQYRRRNSLDHGRPYDETKN